MAEGDTPDEQLEGLAALWRWFAEFCHGYSPLYEQICLAVAEERDVLQMVRAAPPAAHLPPLLLAAVHYLVLDGLEHPLAEVYKGRSDADPVPLFLDVCRTQRAALDPLLATRTVQTNDCGRSALLAPAFTWAAKRFGADTLSLVDVGASAGINLLCDRFHFDYGAAGTTGPADSTVEIVCQVLGGSPPIAAELPRIASRLGIDIAPVDLSKPENVQWLLACVWPDTGRFARTAASIALAQDAGTLVREGHANDLLPGVLAEPSGGALSIVVTTWAFSYLSIDERAQFNQILTEASRSGPVVWVSGDAREAVDAFATAPRAAHPETTDILGAVLFEDGSSRPELLAFVHSHGIALDWVATP